jgi:hypothetical protein
MTMENIEPAREPKDHDILVRDLIGSLHGLDLDKADSTGRVVEDVTYREDARKHGTIRTEHTAENWRVQVSGAHRDGRVNTRADKLAEENDSAIAFANALSERTGKVYVAEHKQVETGAFPDVWIQEQSGSQRLGVEFTNFDKEAISQLEEAGQFGFELTLDQIGQNIRDAITKKNSNVSLKSSPKVDLATKAFLVLICPFPIRQSLYKAIAEKLSALRVDKKFMETWVLPLNQKPFRVQ